MCENYICIRMPMPIPTCRLPRFPNGPYQCNFLYIFLKLKYILIFITHIDGYFCNDSFNVLIHFLPVRFMKYCNKNLGSFFLQLQRQLFVDFLQNWCCSKENTPVLESLFHKVVGLHMTTAMILRTSILKNICERLLLDYMNAWWCPH